MTQTAQKRVSWFAPKLRAEIERSETKIRTLARTWRPDDVENARRSLLRYLHPNGVIPSAETRTELEIALGLKAGALDEDEESETMALLRAATDGFVTALGLAFGPRREGHEA